LKAEYPNELHGYRYRTEKDGSISAVSARGKRLTFRNFKQFSDWSA